MDDELTRLLDLQSGVVSRRQLLEAEHSTSDLQRMLRRRELARVHPGVFINHTGPLTWNQRAWAAVLFASPSALCGISAVRAIAGPGLRGHDDDGPIHVAVDRARQFRAPSGVVAHRTKGLEARAQWNTAPPRLRVEEALIDVAAAAADEFAVVAGLGGAIQARLTTAERLLTAVRSRTRLRHRALLLGVLDDVAQGACSALEQAYLVRVERAHGLPTAARQVRDSVRGPIFRDVDYPGLGVVVELDGRLDHTRARDRDRDLDRDLVALAAGSVTARLGWGQVVGRPCWTARRVHELLVAGGWTMPLVRCPDCPGDGGDSVA